MASSGAAAMDGGSGQALLVETCNTKWEELKRMFEDIQATDRSAAAETLPPEGSDDDRLVMVLQEKERSLRAELAAVKSSKPRVLPLNREVAAVALHEDLSKTERELQAISSLLDNMLEDLEAKTALEQKNATEFLAVNQSLKEKTKEAMEVEEDDGEDPLSDVRRELNVKIKDAEKRHRDLMTELVEFVSEHYPLPSQDDLSKAQKRLRSQQRYSQTNLLPLKDILQELMNKCVDEPDDPYVTITDRFWPPYVELLLRCNLALLHPDDSRRVKMVPFHL